MKLQANLSAAFYFLCFKKKKLVLTGLILRKKVRTLQNDQPFFRKKVRILQNDQLILRKKA